MRICGLGFLGATQSDLQQALDRFSTVCAETGMRMSVDKPEVLVSRSPIQCLIRLDGRTLKQVEKFKYLGVSSCLISPDLS